MALVQFLAVLEYALYTSLGQPKAKITAETVTPFGKNPFNLMMIM